MASTQIRGSHTVPGSKSVASPRYTALQCASASSLSTDPATVSRGHCGQDAEPLIRAIRTRAGYAKREPKSTGGEQIVIDDGRRAKCVGVLYPDGVFVKRMKPEHILRVPPAIAVQRQAIEQLDRKPCQSILAEIEDGRRLTVSYERFRQECFPLDRGFGPQIALLLSKWENANAVQCDLFGGQL